MNSTNVRKKKRRIPLAVGRVARVRSATMSKIRSRDTVPEIILRKQLYAEGIRYRLYRTDLPGRPDIVIGPAKIAIFVDGAFWHGKSWKKRKAAGQFKIRNAFWVDKIEKNIARDRRNTRWLKRMDWNVFRYWDSEVLEDAATIAKEIRKAVRSSGKCRLVKLG